MGHQPTTLVDAHSHTCYNYESGVGGKSGSCEVVSTPRDGRSSSRDTQGAGVTWPLVRGTPFGPFYCVIPAQGAGGTFCKVVDTPMNDAVPAGTLLEHLAHGRTPAATTLVDWTHVTWWPCGPFYCVTPASGAVGTWANA